MTYDDIKRYKKTLLELQALEDKLASYDDRLADTVQGSMAEPPYVKRTIRIEGSGRKTARRRQLEARIEADRRQLAETREEIAHIKDKTVRRILTEHIIRGKTWEEASHGIGADAARMRVKRFFS